MENVNENKVERNDRKNHYVASLTVEQLQELMYQSVRGALKNHFNGLLPFFIKQNDDLETIIRELNEVKLRLDKE